MLLLKSKKKTFAALPEPYWTLWKHMHEN